MQHKYKPYSVVKVRRSSSHGFEYDEEVLIKELEPGLLYWCEGEKYSGYVHEDDLYQDEPPATVQQGCRPNCFPDVYNQQTDYQP